MYILGISAFYHDSAVCFLKNGEIVFASQEERFSRVKNDSSFPLKSLIAGLEFLNIELTDIEEVVFYEKPFIKFERLILTYIKNFPYGFNQFLKSMLIWSKEKLFQKKLINDYLNEIIKGKKKIKFKIKFSDHHLSHASSAYFPSNFSDAAIVTADGVGEFATTTISHAKNNDIVIKKKIDYPHSIGLLYSAFTYYLGFKVNSDEYKVMGLAPYGTPKYKSLILNNLINLNEDGSFHLNQKFFSYSTSFVMTNKKFDNLFSFNRRKKKDDLITQEHMDIASSIQSVTEDIMLSVCRYAKKITNSENLCLAGGVALNCVVNGKIIDSKIFKNVWIQPSSGDAGGALGCSLVAFYNKSPNNTKRAIDNSNIDQMKNSYLGISINDKDIDNCLHENNFIYKKFETFSDLCEQVSEDLTKSLIVGWCQGRAEYGPRALGHRSILADPRGGDMQKKLNLKIKYRESFRPFAPIVMIEFLNDFFELDEQSPYMLIVKKVKKDKLLDIKEELKGFEKINQIRSVIPAVTHVDNTARIQTVTKNNTFIYPLIKKFYEKTKYPLLVNTSFNLSEEPIVNNAKDAIHSFKNCGLDVLVINNYYVKK